MIDQSLDAERARHERYGQPMAFLLIDVDHFKAINDRYGHEAGDAVLRSVARVIQAGVRDVDVPARFGGEEFAVLLPETLPEAAADVAERLRSNVERIEVPWGGDTLRVRISVGVSSCPDCVRDPHLLVRSADAALYQAKVLGRNRVIRAPASG
jgi:diguanylate cyclase